MIKLIKKIWYSIVPTEKERKASDVVLRSMDNRTGREYTLTIPTVSVPKNKDGYYVQEPLALPESMRKAMGYGYETEPGLEVVK